METVTDFTFLTSKITVDGDCIHEIKKILTLCTQPLVSLLGRVSAWCITQRAILLRVEGVLGSGQFPGTQVVGSDKAISDLILSCLDIY